MAINFHGNSMLKQIGSILRTTGTAIKDKTEGINHDTVRRQIRCSSGDREAG